MPKISWTLLSVERQEREIKRYMETCATQKRVLKEDKKFLVECTDLMSRSVPSIPKVKEIVENVVVPEPEVTEMCTYIRRVEINSNPKCEKLKDCSSMSFRTKFIQRIEKIKANFSTCQQGAEFWDKTEPLWNKMTQCVDGESITASSEFDLYKNYMMPSLECTTLLQQLMENNFHYNLSDNTVIELMKKALAISIPGTAAADIIRLVQRMVEHEADKKANVGYMVFGLIQRSVFEYTKKIISKQIFVDARKSVDRLQHLNDKGVNRIIPINLIRNKEVSQIVDIVHDLIDNEEVYGKFDRPIDDEKAYVELTTTHASDHMLKFLQKRYDSTTVRLSSRLFQMPLRSNIPQLVDGWVAKFLKAAHQNLARFVSTDHIDELEELFGNRDKSKLTLRSVFRISRKIAKLLFKMLKNDEKRLDNFKKTAFAYTVLVSSRTSRVKYDLRKLKPREDLGLAYRKNVFDKLNPRAA